MNRTNHLSLLAGAACLALAHRATAQAPILLGARAEHEAPSEDQWFRPIDRAWPDELPQGQVRKTLTARITGNFQPDVVMLDDDNPVVASAPGIHRSITSLPEPLSGEPLTNVLDIAVLKGRGLANGSNPMFDALALVGPDGLYTWRQVVGANPAEHTRIGGAEWVNTQLLAVYPEDPSRIYGVDANGLVRRADAQGTGYVTSSLTFQVQGTPLAIACADFDPMLQGAEVAVLTSTCLGVFSSAGSPLWTMLSTATSGSLTVVRDRPVGNPVDWLVWLVPGTTSQLNVCRAYASTPVPLAGRFVGATAVSIEGDDWEDLVLSTVENEDVTVLFNQQWQGLFPFAYDPAFAIRVAVDAASPSRGNNRSNAAVADFDADGDCDFYVPLAPDASNGAFRMVLSKFYDNDSPIEILSDGCTRDEHLGTATFNFDFADDPNSTATEIVVWPEKDHSGESLLEALAVQRQVIPVVPGPRTHASIVLPLSHLDNGDLYVVMMRPVKMVNGQITQVAEPYLGSLWTAAGIDRAYEAAGLPVPLDGNPKVGGITPRPDLPPAPPSDPPEPGG